MTADLLRYDALIRKGETIQPAQKLIDGEGSAARVAAQQLKNPLKHH